MALPIKGLDDYSFLPFDPDTRLSRVMRIVSSALSAPYRTDARLYGAARRMRDLLSHFVRQECGLYGNSHAPSPILASRLLVAVDDVRQLMYGTVVVPTRARRSELYKEARQLWEVFRSQLGVVYRRDVVIGVGLLTNPIILEYRNLGQFLVWAGVEFSTQITPFLGTTRLPSGHVHAHISDTGTPCWGTGSATIAEIAIRKRGLRKAFLLGLELLNSYTAGHYANLEQWPVGPVRGQPYPLVPRMVSCNRCHGMFQSALLTACGGCGETCCPRCDPNTDMFGVRGHTGCLVPCKCGRHWKFPHSPDTNGARCYVCAALSCITHEELQVTCSAGEHTACEQHTIPCCYCGTLMVPCHHELIDVFRSYCHRCGIMGSCGHPRRRRVPCGICGRPPNATPTGDTE